MILQVDVQSGRAEPFQADGGTKARHLTCQARVPARSLSVKNGRHHCGVLLVLLVDFERNLPWPMFGKELYICTYHG